MTNKAQKKRDMEEKSKVPEELQKLLAQLFRELRTCNVEKKEANEKVLVLATKILQSQNVELFFSDTEIAKLTGGGCSRSSISKIRKQLEERLQDGRN